MIILVVYLAIIQVIAYSVMGFDKRRAGKQKRRVSEKRLWLIAWIGGAVGMFLGMRKFRHKTQKAVFRIGLPLLAALQIAIVAGLAYYLTIVSS